jgi:uncharacterized MAPEG superfamily protein
MGDGMTFAYWCVLVAGVLPIFTISVAKWGRHDFDNAEPRAWLDQQQGLRRRADYAHRNHFEALPLFAAAVIIASLTHAPQNRINLLAGLFIVARVAYTGFYLGNQASLRSLSFLVGFACVLGLFGVAAMA